MNSRTRIKQLEKSKPMARDVSSDDIQKMVEDLVRFINTVMVEQDKAEVKNANQQAENSATGKEQDTSKGGS